MRHLFRVLLPILLLGFSITSCKTSQQTSNDKKQHGKAIVFASAFYNVENLFDTENDPNNRGDDDFLPSGPYQWTPEKYQQKLHNIARVMSELAHPLCPNGPAFIGIAEVENARVIKDLIQTEPLKEMQLDYVHYESPDHRGIDVGFIYNPRLFTVTSSHPHATIIPGKPNYHTRDILEVDGLMAGERFTILVNHWPSKYGGAASAPLRDAAAELARAISDSIRKADPMRKIIVMGDLNDDPSAHCCSKAFGAAPKRESTPKGGFFNATWPLFANGVGTLCYQDVWGLYDQQIISDNLIGTDYTTLKYFKTEVFNPDYLITPSGKKKGYPFRSFNKRVWQNGYADHFPTITYYVKRIKN